MTVKTIGYIYLDEDDVMEIHTDQLSKFGGSDGVRNRDGLESAVAQPQMTFGADDLYPDVFLKAAVLAYGLPNHRLLWTGISGPHWSRHLPF